MEKFFVFSLALSLSIRRFEKAFWKERVLVGCVWDFLANYSHQTQTLSRGRTENFSTFVHRRQRFLFLLLMDGLLNRAMRSVSSVPAAQCSYLRLEEPPVVSIILNKNMGLVFIFYGVEERQIEEKERAQGVPEEIGKFVVMNPKKRWSQQNRGGIQQNLDEGNRGVVNNMNNAKEVQNKTSWVNEPQMQNGTPIFNIGSVHTNSKGTNGNSEMRTGRRYARSRKNLNKDSDGAKPSSSKRREQKEKSRQKLTEGGMIKHPEVLTPSKGKMNDADTSSAKAPKSTQKTEASPAADGSMVLLKPSTSQ